MTPDDLTRSSPPDADATRPADDPTTATGDAAAAIRELNTDTGVTVGTPPATPSAIDPPPGFVLERELGEGGMGVVYLARQLGLNRPVALKLVKPSAKVDAKALIRFLAEAEVVAAIRHPHVVEVYQYGEHAGKPYMALEFCPGGDLTSLVSRDTQGSAPKDAAWFRRVADLMAKVADGVNAAHALGIVHRDLKPHNVFLANPPGEPAASAAWVPKVADFGLAKRGIGSDLTNTEAVMGTPAYMAPEQAGGGTKFVGPEADVWALGVMLYELCCGQRPIDTSGPLLDALARVARGEVSQLRTKLPAIPADLSLIVHKCLSRDPRDRYPTAGALATDLRNWLDGKPISARPTGVVEQAVKWAKRNKKLAMMGAAVLLTMAAATGVSFGFGVEARSQADRANQKQADAEQAALVAAREREDAVAARNDLVKANEQTERVLGDALLGPIRAGDRKDPLSAYEQKALWQLYSLRGGPVGRLLLEQGLAAQLTAAQLAARSDFLFHGAIGLDHPRRTRIGALLSEHLRDPQASPDRKWALTIVALGSEQFWGENSELSNALFTAVGDAQNLRQQLEAATVLAAVVGRLRGEEAEKAVKVLDSLLRSVWDHSALRSIVLDGLVAGVRQVRVANAEKVCETNSRWLITRLSEEESESARAALLAYVAQLNSYLPPGRREVVCERWADEVLEAMDRVPDTLETPKDYVRLERLSRVLATAVKGVSAERAEVYCDKARDILLTQNAGSLRIVPYPPGLGLSAIAAGLPASRLERTTRLLIRQLADDNLTPHAWDIAIGLAAVASRLPQEQAAEASKMISACLEYHIKAAKDIDPEKMGVGLRAVAPRLTPIQVEEVVKAVLEAMEVRTHPSVRRALAAGLSSLAERLPAQEAKRVLTIAAVRASTAAEHRELATGVAALSKRMTADQAEEMCDTTAASLLTTLNDPKTAEGRELVAEGLSVLAERLPADRALRLLLAAFDRAANDDERGAVGVGLIATAARLSPDTAAEILWMALGAATRPEVRRAMCGPLREAAIAESRPRREHRAVTTELASLAGGVAFYPALPPPRPLPSQMLVDLLKHPFCVMEARRAVLDALEFTYDRKFADLWEFVAFAEKEHPELDLLTPPKRPEKK